MAVGQRFELLGKVAQELRIARGDLMGAALADGGKTPMESDPEISEAIDFLEFYRDTARWWQQMPTLQARPKGSRRRAAGNFPSHPAAVGALAGTR
jgi:RHH-type proline utilization regulon transcriptional repressor/proline dehydrogenase/delta 1-pyrroline-5-carboxylate dehydrogenase